MSRRRARVNTGSTNLPRLIKPSSFREGDSGSGSRARGVPRHAPHAPVRVTTQSQARAAKRLVFPPRVRPAVSIPGPRYPPLKNVHVVPRPVDYDRKFGFAKLREQKVRTQAELFKKYRRGRMPGLTAEDLDGDGVIDTTEIRLAAVLRELDGAEDMSHEDKVHAGRLLLVNELVGDLDGMEYARMGKHFVSQPRDVAVQQLADDPNFRERFNEYLNKKATVKLQSSSRAKGVLQQTHTARLQAEQQHAADRAKHERNIWQASRSRAAELARNIRTADRFRQATQGYSSLSSFNNVLARNRDVSLSRVNHMRP